MRATQIDQDICMRNLTWDTPAGPATGVPPSVAQGPTAAGTPSRGTLACQLFYHSLRRPVLLLTAQASLAPNDPNHIAFLFKIMLHTANGSSTLHHGMLASS